MTLSCPACGHALAPGEGALSCGGCGRSFPLVAGVPDIRLGYADPYVTLEEDVARARTLGSRIEELDFAGLVREHWRMSGTRPELAERFLAGDVGAAGRAEHYLAEIERARGRALGPGDSFLEVGCGTAALATAAAARGASAVAADVSMRWCVLARKRLAEAGLEDVEIVCCDAEEPPFAPGSFDVVAASDVIEHVASQDAFVVGCRHVLVEGGLLFLATPNRFSLGLEPHVRLWGVGFLPRPLARRYVQALRRTRYDHVRLLSARSLRRLLAANGLEATIVPPEIPAATQRLYGGLELRLVRAYNRLRSAGPLRRVLLAVGPFFHVFARKGAR